MKKFILSLAAIVCGVGVSYASITVVDRGIAPCSYGLPGVSGSCHFWETYPIYNLNCVSYPAKGCQQYIGSFGASYIGATQMNVFAFSGQTGMVIDQTYDSKGVITSSMTSTYTFKY